MPPSRTRPNHNTRDSIPYSFRTVSVFFNVPHHFISRKGCETDMLTDTSRLFYERALDMRSDRARSELAIIMSHTLLKEASTVLCSVEKHTGSG